MKLQQTKVYVPTDVKIELSNQEEDGKAAMDYAIKMVKLKGGNFTDYFIHFMQGVDYKVQQEKDLKEGYFLTKEELEKVIGDAFDAGDLYGRNDMAFSCGRIGRVEAESADDKQDYINSIL